MLIGISGKYCAGKNAVAAILEKRGFFLIDADKLGHEALSRKKGRIVERFGKGILRPDGSVDRKRLGAIVFKDRKALRELEAITHPEIRAAAAELVRTHREKGPVAIHAALLFAMDFKERFDFVIWVDAPLGQRLVRAVRRDQAGLLHAIRRMWAQRKLASKSSSVFTDMYTVINGGDLGSLEAQIDEILRKETQV